jgi:hypothetical protein
VAHNHNPLPVLFLRHSTPHSMVIDSLSLSHSHTVTMSLSITVEVATPPPCTAAHLKIRTVSHIKIAIEKTLPRFVCSPFPLSRCA